MKRLSSFLFFVRKPDGPRRFPLLKNWHNLPQNISFGYRVFSSGGESASGGVPPLCIALRALQTLFRGLHVGEDQFKVNNLNITDWVNLTRYVMNVVVMKYAHYFRNGIHFSYVRQKLISQSLALGCALYKPCD